jgi:hypothetical protein
MLHRKSLTIPLLLAAGVVCCVSISASAGTTPFLLTNGNIGITVDENCNGTINGFGGPQALPCGFANDPGPGGLANVMTYNLLGPPGLVVGDVLLTDADCGGCFLDVIRFNPNGTLVFYSDNIDGFDSGADTFGPPGAFYANLVAIPEVGTESINGATYIPTAGMPGFVAGLLLPSNTNSSATLLSRIRS